MKKTMIPSLAALAISLIAGCSQRNNDGAKLEALTRKVDLLIQNQALIYSNQVNLHDAVMVINGQMSAVPSLRDMDSILHFYHTNSVSRLDKIDSDIELLGQLADLRGNANGAALTNLLNDTSDIKSGLLEIRRDLTRMSARMGM